MSLSGAVPGGRRHHLSSVQMRKPRALKEDGCSGAPSLEPLCPLLVSGSFTAALGQQSLLSLTWGFLDQGVGEAEFWQEPWSLLQGRG